jgi:hypothetical protein
MDTSKPVPGVGKCQLVRFSHKRDKGEFIAGKLDAANLPCPVDKLVGTSKEEVLVDPLRHNAAARRRLAEP